MGPLWRLGLSLWAIGEICEYCRIAELYPCERAARDSCTILSFSGAVCRERAARAIDAKNY